MARNRGVCLTQVHPSHGDDAETDIDIIAIHGLDTKSPDTWIWKSENPDQDVNWLACPHMLPASVGSARIFMCDWPAELFERPDLIQKTVEVFARLLLACIKRRPLPKPRDTQKKDRPIVFIASCLGGIILIKALLIANHPPNEYTAIRRSTRGIIFLATPFRGTSFQDVANWAEPGLRAWASIRGQKVSSLLDSVKGSTFKLEDLVRDFTQLCQDKDYPCRLLTFYETGMTSLHRKFPLNWLIPPSLLNLVCQLKPVNIVTNPLPLDRRHVMMNKFESPQDADYQCVSGKIRELLEEIRESSPLDKADAWIQNKHYTANRLKIERLSGDLLSMDQCYINLAVVEHRGQGSSRSNKADGTPSPLSLFGRQKVETPESTVQVELEAIFNQRTGRDGNTIQPRRILIRGSAGVGKTTLCKKIVHEFIQGTWREWNDLFDRVLWVPLRNLKLEERCRQRGYNFEQLFIDEFFSQSYNKEIFAKAFALELETDSSKTLFLLDGLDEISQGLISNSSMANFLNEPLRQPNIIVTSRPSGKLPLDLDLELETIGFYPEQVGNYIKRVFTDSETLETDEETVDKIQSFLQNHWLVQGLVRIPIQLDALCYSWRDIRSERLETMTALYQAIELSLWKKDILRLKKTHGQDPVTLDHIQDCSRRKIEEFVRDEIYFLESLAFTGLCNDIIEFEPKHLNRISDSIHDFLPDKTIPCLSFLRTSNPSLENRSRSYHFIHLTFQEYFAARYFVRRWVTGEPLNCMKFGSGRVDKTESFKFFQIHKYTARYDVLWRFIAGLLDTRREEIPSSSHKVEEFFQKIEEEPLDLLGPTHQRLVMHCLSEVSNDLMIRTDLEQQLLKWLLFESREVEFPEQELYSAIREGSNGMKLAILRALRMRSTIPANIIKQAASLLELKNSSIRKATIEAFRRKPALPDKILKAVLARLEDKAWVVREAAINTLSRQASFSNEIFMAILARLEDENWDVQKAVAVALGQQTALPLEILRVVAQLLESDDLLYQQTAITILGQQVILPHEIVETVAALLEDGRKHYVQGAAITVLTQQKILPNNVQNAISARLNDASWDTREAALKALGQQKALPDTILEVVVARLEDKNEDKSLRESAVNVLGQQTALSDAFLKALFARLRDESEDMSVKKAAITALGRRGLPDEILEAITVRLNDANWDIREAAVKTLCRQAALPEKILKAVAARLEDDHKYIRRAAIIALGRQALPNKYLKAIAARLEDLDRSVREAAVQVLCRRTLPNDILKAVLAQLEDKREHESIRRTTIMALGRRVLPKEALKVVTAQLEDNDILIRIGALSVLTHQVVLPDDILKAVAVRLEDNHEAVQLTAEGVVRRHEDFYCTLLKSSFITSLYRISLGLSFKEQISWYFDDGYLFINMPEGIRKVPIDEHNDIRAAIKEARPENYPTK
ncbi:hypothetical protein V8C35DRAFT_322296 [Trichoderma chlorosporum]